MGGGWIQGRSPVQLRGPLSRPITRSGGDPSAPFADGSPRARESATPSDNVPLHRLAFYVHTVGSAGEVSSWFSDMPDTTVVKS
jgi:hypothetical protein